MASEQLAVLFADVCDSTTIYEAIGDDRALAAISALFGALIEKVRARGGVIVKTIGDGMVCRFKDPDSAFNAACDIQETAVAAESGEGPKLSIKVATAQMEYTGTVAGKKITGEFVQGGLRTPLELTQTP